LQEEAAGKTKKLKKVFGMLMSAKAELSDLQYEQQREMEGLLDSIRSLTRELKLQETIIDAFIPRQYQARPWFFASSPAHSLTFLCCFYNCGKLFAAAGSESCTKTKGHPLLTRGAAAFETKRTVSKNSKMFSGSKLA
jgi:hypothetical protein